MAGQSRFLATVAVASLISACGGGGSSGGPPVQSAPPAPLALPSPMPAPQTTPSNANFDTPEYQNSSAAIGSNAIGAWQAGANGRGVTVGFVDTGLVSSLSDFAGRISPLSRDVAGTRPMGDVYGHGTAVAGIAAAARDNAGMQGIAYESTIFMAKADEGCPTRCSFPAEAVARGIDAAREAGAKVINLSIGGSSTSDIRRAVQRAVDAGIVIVIGAGNSGTQPTEMARDLAAVSPGQVIIVGALGVTAADGSINWDVPSIYTVPAASSRASFLAAPGWLNSATYFNGGGTDKLSGTSFAAPVVSGAVALIAQAYPMLSAQQIVLLLYSTADDLGMAGIDSTFGRGRLNIGRAFQPVGAIKLAGSAHPIPASLGSLPAAAGDAAAIATLNAKALDSFNRPFDVNLASAFEGIALAGPLAQFSFASGSSFAGKLGAATLELTLDSPRPQGPLMKHLGLSPAEERSAKLLAATAIMRLSSTSSFAIGFGLTSDALLSDPKSQAAFMLTDRANARQGFDTGRPVAVMLEKRRGPLSLRIAGEKGTIPSHSSHDRNSVYFRAGGNVSSQWKRGMAALGIQRIQEDRSFLGAPTFGLMGKGGARTWFVDAGINQSLDSFALNATYRRGVSVFGGDEIVTSAFSVDVSRSSPFDADARLALRLSQPLRVERGRIDMSVPVSWDYRTSVATQGFRGLPLIPSGRELDLEAAYLTNLPTGMLSIHAYARRQPNHVRDTKGDLGTAIRVSLVW